MYMRQGMMENMLRMPRATNLIEHVMQGVLTVGLECNVEVDGSVGRWVAQALPVFQHSMPGVLDMHIFPMW